MKKQVYPWTGSVPQAPFGHVLFLCVSRPPLHRLPCNIVPSPTCGCFPSCCSPHNLGTRVTEPLLIPPSSPPTKKRCAVTHEGLKEIPVRRGTWTNVGIKRRAGAPRKFHRTEKSELVKLPTKRTLRSACTCGLGRKITISRRSDVHLL